MIKSVKHLEKQFTLSGRMCALLCLLCWPMTSLAQPLSDLLIVVDQDGQGYTAQLTVFAEDEMIISRIPRERKNLQTEFAGSGSALYRRAHEKSPDKITVISGSVFTRFRHRFDIVDNSENNAKTSIVAPVMRAPLNEFITTMADAASLVFRVSWVLPANIELFDYGSSTTLEAIGNGAWQTSDNNIVTYEQNGGAPPELWLEYRVHDTLDHQQACLASVGPSEWCSPDIDNDRVPDYRDLCITEPSDAKLPNKINQPNIILADNSYAELLTDTAAIATSNIASLGCDDDSRIVLSKIQFENSRTYLNAKARSTLDTVAVALQRIPEKLYRIASYTDSVGNVNNNQQLSEDRAAAIRHYLMLRGVSPNQIQARGFGEAQPAHDNSTAAGRRKNRRVELQLLN